MSQRGMVVGLDYANPYMSLGTSYEKVLFFPLSFCHQGAPTRSFSASSSILESRRFSRSLGRGRNVRLY